MQPSRMFRHALLLHKRDPQRSDLSDLPSSIGNPTATLPQSIGPSGVTADPSATAQIVTAEAPSGFTTVTETESLVESITSLNTVSTVATTKTRIITDQSEYASLTSAAALSASTSTRATTSKTSAAATSSAASEKSSSTNTSTLIPAIVVPVVVVLLASLGIFWFLMRRRHKRELDSQPEFVMAGKGEKLSSRSNSGRSTSSLAESEKKLTAIQSTEIPSVKSPPSTTSEWPSSQIGLARPLTPQGTKPVVASRPMEQSRPGTAPAERQYRNFSGPAPRPTTSGRPGPPTSTREPPQHQQQQRNRGYSNPAQRGPPPPSKSGPSPTPRAVRTPDPVRGGPSPVSQRPSPTMSSSQGVRSESKANAAPPPSAFRLRDPSPSMNHNGRAQAPPRLAAPPPGAYNGASSISRYSPIVKETPGIPVSKASSVKRGPPPPLQTSNLARRQGSKSPHSASPGLTEENMRIARLANSSRLGGYTPAEPSPSPKLPPPATRSQLIPRESPKGKPENYFGGSTTSEPQSPAAVSMSLDPRAASDRASIVSDPDEYEDIDAKSDISSLNEFERFDFGAAAAGAGSRGGSAAGQSLNYFASHNSPAGGRGSPFGNDATYERW
ncbi:hypothetical protein PV05_10038 [Exophiala xenobiotica]|uniref:Uncharacterized protein n=1 Tax=Exophiala xenobiotica TaxID=348802 RepID=A0A0D2BGD0_9EURO|nr:uncharacterized protein PV05_10038 [Exophiala xenobiotica]KIW51301.1 hypothetical protein PV05_10038 [Exophiala xenobiotica]